MAAYLLDTDTLSLYQRDDPTVLRQVAAHLTDVIAVSVVTVEEQISGWSRLARAARTPQARESASRFLAELVPTWSLFTLIPVSVASLGIFDGLIRQKLNVRSNDSRIAAAALDLGATVVTRNT